MSKNIKLSQIADLFKNLIEQDKDSIDFLNYINGIKKAIGFNVFSGVYKFPQELLLEIQDKEFFKQMPEPLKDKFINSVDLDTCSSNFANTLQLKYLEHLLDKKGIKNPILTSLLFFYSEEVSRITQESYYNGKDIIYLENDLFRNNDINNKSANKKKLLLSIKTDIEKDIPTNIKSIICGCYGEKHSQYFIDVLSESSYSNQQAYNDLLDLICLNGISRVLNLENDELQGFIDKKRFKINNTRDIDFLITKIINENKLSEKELKFDYTKEDEFINNIKNETGLFAVMRKVPLIGGCFGARDARVAPLEEANIAINNSNHHISERADIQSDTRSNVRENILVENLQQRGKNIFEPSESGAENNDVKSQNSQQINRQKINSLKRTKLEPIKINKNQDDNYKKENKIRIKKTKEPKRKLSSSERSIEEFFNFDKL